MINDKKILALIPARGGSKGIANKNLCKLNHESLLSRTIRIAKQSHYIDRIIVTSENEAILAEASLAKADIVRRSAALAADETPTMSVVLDVLKQVDAFDYILLLQVTSPMREVIDINTCLEWCTQRHAPACVSVQVPKHHPYWMVSINKDDCVLPYVSGKIPHRRQELPPIYAINGAIYLANINWLQDSKTFVTSETLAYVMPPERSFDIDSSFDLDLTTSYLKFQEQGKFYE